MSAFVINSVDVLDSNLSVTSIEERFKHLVFTRCAKIEDGIVVEDGERVMLPHFGSMLYELIDKSMDYEWTLRMKKYLFECFFDENQKLWDRDFNPKTITVSSLDVPNGKIDIAVGFKNTMEVNFGYTV